MKKLLIILTLAFSVSFSIYSQELKCNVIVVSDKIPGTNKQVFTSLQNAIGDFVNNRKWSDFQYASNEKIECSFIITINSQADNSYKASIQIQARRPVFNSAYYTSLFSFKDEYFNFQYLEMTQLEYTEGMLGSNLTAVIAYYCYLIVGYDCDSYAKLGGTPYFKKAEAIVSLAQNDPQKENGWKAFESNRNRYALINNLLDENLKKYREFYYDYHRLGLDEMHINIGKSTQRIATSMQALIDVNRAKPSNVVLNSFLETKADEIINIFSKAPAKEKQEVYELLMDIDPSQANKYAPLINN